MAWNSLRDEARPSWLLRRLAIGDYARVCRSPDEINTALLCTKTKDAPLKCMTIPRLELSATVMLTKLVSHMQRVLNVPTHSVHLWTDLSIVLTWMNHHPRWKEDPKSSLLRPKSAASSPLEAHLRQDNPANCAIRGLSASQLGNHQLWWSGPTWLCDNPTLWPNHSLSPTPNQPRALEKRKFIQSLYASTDEHIWDLDHQFSSLERLLRITAICKRVRRVPNTSLNYVLTPEKLTEARTSLDRSYATQLFPNRD